MLIRDANQSDIAEIADLHRRAFPGFFLTSLGLSFLRELYAGFLSHPSGILLVANQNGHIVGFVGGTSAPDLFFSSLRRRRGIAFVLKAIPSILRNPLPVCKKLFLALRYRGEVPALKLPGALLSSIGTATECRGSGLATRLILAFERRAKDHGSEFVYLTTDANDNDRVNAFYRKHQYLPLDRFLQNGKREMIRYQKFL